MIDAHLLGHTCGDCESYREDEATLDYVDIRVMDQLEPIARFSRGGIVTPKPKPLVCDCGHLDSLHSTAPGIGCTNRPYCLCVHPTGQRVPRTAVRI